MSEAHRDQNRVTTLLGINDVTGLPQEILVNSSGAVLVSVSGTGLVVGPASSTDNAIARFDGITGQLLQNSAVTIADTTGAISGTQSVTIGVAGSATGTLLMKGTTSGTVTIKTADAAGTWTLTLPTDDGTANQVLTTDGNGITSWATNGVGTVTSVSVTTANGVSGSVATATTTPAITLTLGVITPTSVNGLTLAAQAVGFTIAGGSTSKTLTVPLDASVSGTNTGDQTNISGNAATVTTNANLTGPVTSTGNATAIANSIALPASPTTTTQAPADNSTKIATTAYVDNAVLGQNFKEAAKYATTAALPSIVYANGSSGVGATLTGVALAAISVDSASPVVADRILVKNQVSTFQNGIYTVTATGSGIAVFVLTRATDADQTTDYKTGDSLFVTSGTVNSATTWAYSGINSPVIGTDAITFVQAAGQGSFSAGNGITITGNSIAIDTAVTVDKTTVQTLTNKTLTSPTLTTPSLGVATATSINGLAITSSTGTLSITNAKTLAATNSITLTGTDSKTYTFPTTDATLARIDAGQTFTGVQVMTSPDITTSLTTPSSTFALLNTTATTINFAGASGSVVNVGGGAAAAELRFLEPSGSGTNYSAFKVAAQSANITYTLPTAVGAATSVLTDAAGNGTLSWAVPSSSGGTPRNIICFPFETIGTDALRYDLDASGSGTQALVAGGVQLACGSTDGSYSQIAAYMTISGTGTVETVYNSNFELQGRVILNNDSTAEGFVSAFVTNTNTLPSTSGGLTAEHMGFILDGNGGGGGAKILYASNANGTQTTTDITGALNLQGLHTYRCVQTGSTNVLFYVDKTLLATQTTNLPSSTQSQSYWWSLSVDNDTGVTTTRSASAGHVTVLWDAS